MKKLATVAAVLFLACTAVVALADDAPWGPVTGRASQVVIRYRQFDAPSATIAVYSVVPSVSPSGYEIFAGCNSSFDSMCIGLMSSANYPAACSWTALSNEARAALTYLIGGSWCGSEGHPVCIAETFGNQAMHIDHWYCSGGAHYANCLSMEGVLTPGLRIGSVTQTSNCSF